MFTFQMDFMYRMSIKYGTEPVSSALFICFIISAVQDTLIRTLNYS